MLLGPKEILFDTFRKLLLGLLLATQPFDLPSACSNDAVTMT